MLNRHELNSNIYNPIPRSVQVNEQLAVCCSAKNDQHTTGTQPDTLSIVEFHLQSVRNAPTDVWVRTRSRGTQFTSIYICLFQGWRRRNLPVAWPILPSLSQPGSPTRRGGCCWPAPCKLQMFGRHDSNASEVYMDDVVGVRRVWPLITLYCVFLPQVGSHG